jgi:hypothetical protein
MTSSYPYQRFIYGIYTHGSIKVITPLQFAIDMCEAVNEIYEGCGYLAHGTSARKAIKPTIHQNGPHIYSIMNGICHSL